MYGPVYKLDDFSIRNRAITNPSFAVGRLKKEDEQIIGVFTIFRELT